MNFMSHLKEKAPLSGGREWAAGTDCVNVSVMCLKRLGPPTSHSISVYQGPSALVLSSDFIQLCTGAPRWPFFRTAHFRTLNSQVL